MFFQLIPTSLMVALMQRTLLGHVVGTQLKKHYTKFTFWYVPNGKKNLKNIPQ